MPSLFKKSIKLHIMTDEEHFKHLFQKWATAAGGNKQIIKSQMRMLNPEQCQNFEAYLTELGKWQADQLRFTLELLLHIAEGFNNES